MKIRILSVTHKTPTWLKEGYQDYVKRLPMTLSLELIEIPAEKRTPNTITSRLIEKEGEKLTALIKPSHLVIALDVHGKAWSTEQLAIQLHLWQQEARNVDLLVGGPDGLSAACLKRTEMQWSLSTLTFPHLFVRLIVAEQIYRAWTILTKHPYHR